MAKRPSKAAPREVEVARPEAAPLHPPPIALDDLIGHERPAAILADAARADRIHHAWVFHGPTGVGKFTTALAFAADLLTPGDKPRGASRKEPSKAAAMLAAGSHPDLHIIRKELARYHHDREIRDRKQTNIPIDVIREFLLAPGALAATVPGEGPVRKVFIVDEAELLAPAAQNAVLKFLEEPPEGTVTILVTSADHHLLPTIRSRCQRVAFAPLAPRDMDRWMSRAGIKPAKAEREWLLALAEGAPGVVASAIAGGLHEWSVKLAPGLEAARAGRYTISLGSTMHELVEAWAQAAVEANPNASKEAANKAGADWMMRVLAVFWRGVLRDEPGDPGPALACLDAIREAEREVDSNVNPQFVFEKLSAEFAAACADDAPTPAR
jgi:DNA polymerase III subunit delta'